jgi:hypothetical protein
MPRTLTAYVEYDRESKLYVGTVRFGVPTPRRRLSMSCSTI